MIYFVLRINSWQFSLENTLNNHTALNSDNMNGNVFGTVGGVAKMTRLGTKNLQEHKMCIYSSLS